jgi:hypothetical protein
VFNASGTWGKRYGEMDRGSSFEPKGLPSLPPLADLRMNQAPLFQLHPASGTDDPLPLQLCSSQNSQLAILRVWRQCRQRSALETIKFALCFLSKTVRKAQPRAQPRLRGRRRGRHVISKARMTISLQRINVCCLLPHT